MTSTGGDDVSQCIVIKAWSVLFVLFAMSCKQPRLNEKDTSLSHSQVFNLLLQPAAIYTLQQFTAGDKGIDIKMLLES